VSSKTVIILSSEAILLLSVELFSASSSILIIVEAAITFVEEKIWFLLVFIFPLKLAILYITLSKLYM
jgi:hypothetical protein